MPQHTLGDYGAGVWSVETADELSLFQYFQAIHAHYVILLGETYLKHIEDEIDRWRHVRYPFRDDDLGGIGDQMQWLRNQIDSYHPPGQADLKHYETNGGEPR